MLDRIRRSPWLLPALLTVAAGVLLFVRLGHPGRIYFDEVYYVGDARDYLRTWVEGSFAVHPPVGKWIIAAGIALFGDQPFGWRFTGALAGTATVLLTYLVALRLFGKRWLAAFVALLLLTDGLFLVQSRIAMLDVYLLLFTVLGAWLLLVDHDRSRLGPEHDLGPDEADDRDGRTAGLTTRHPYRYAAGVAFGLAVATKWSGALPLAAAVLVALGWELAARRRRTGLVRTRLLPAFGSVAASLALVPVAVYVLSFVPWLVHYPQTSEGKKVCPAAEETAGSDTAAAPGCDVGVTDRLRGLWRWHDAVLTFHRTLQAEHPYRTPAWTWPVMARPVVYYWETCEGEPNDDEVDSGDTVYSGPPCAGPDEDAEIFNVGNPTLWYLFPLAMIPVAAGAAQRDRRAWFVLAFWGLQYAPWLIAARPLFFFYMTPVVPFLALALGYAAAWLSERRSVLVPLATAATGAVVGLVVGWVVIEPLFDVVTATRWIGLGAGVLVGAAAGGLVDRRYPDWVAVQRPPRLDTGKVVAGLAAATAVALFLFFYPTWTGLPLPDDALRDRWWIEPGWI